VEGTSRGVAIRMVTDILDRGFVRQLDRQHDVVVVGRVGVGDACSHREVGSGQHGARRRDAHCPLVGARRCRRASHQDERETDDDECPSLDTQQDRPEIASMSATVSPRRGGELVGTDWAGGSHSPRLRSKPGEHLSAGCHGVSAACFREKAGSLAGLPRSASTRSRFTPAPSTAESRAAVRVLRGA